MCKACFKVDSTSVASEFTDHEPRSPNGGNDFIVDVVDVFDVVDLDGLETGFAL